MAPFTVILSIPILPTVERGLDWPPTLQLINSCWQDKYYDAFCFHILENSILSFLKGNKNPDREGEPCRNP
jgi:hypothetical protein